MNWALLALFAALALFWLSTRQFATIWRLVLWLAALAVLIGAGWLVLESPTHFGLLTAIVDLGRHLGDPENSVLISTWRHNEGSASHFILQFVDVALLLCVPVAILCTAAFTRGERIEQTTRPVLFWLLGVLCGGLFAFAIVTVGFGGQARPTVYVGELTSRDIHDGDTFWLGGTPLRLWALDAPELSQKCRDTQREDCGEWAREHLIEITRGALITCTQQFNSANSRMDSFGRPLVECVARRGEVENSLSRQMIADGFAVQFKNRDFGLGPVEQSARTLNIMAGCTIRPEEYRNNTQARRAWRADFTVIPGTQTIGSGCAHPTP
jgi:endonuclease YncB( thermonuclease family)